MEEIAAVIKIVLGGGIQGLMAILLGIIGYLIWDRHSIQKNNAEVLKELSDTLSEKFDHDREQLIKIIDQYHQGQISIVQAMNEIKLLLTSISARL